MIRDKNIELAMNDQYSGVGHLLSKENQPNDSSSEINISHKKKWKFIITLLVISIIVIGGIATAYFFLFPNISQPETPTPFSPIDPSPEWSEEIKDVFSPSFIITSKENTLTQIFQKSYQKYKSTFNGENSSYTIITEAIYDIYTINSTKCPENHKGLYTTLYTTVITLNSLCSKKSNDPENDECQLETKLDLNKRVENNLRRNEENPKDLIKQAILPICIVEHTDTNLIFSMTCPETISVSLKNDILRAFTNIKPGSIKNFEFDKEYVDTKKEEKDDKIYINSFDNVCLEPNLDPSKEVICNLTKDIITDKEGNLISSKIANTTKTMADKNNYFLNNFTYEFTNIPKENSVNFDEGLYKQNLDNIFSLAGSLMKKEILMDNLTNFVYELTSDFPENKTELRNLIEEETNPGVHEENIFNKSLFNISINYDLKNDIGFGLGQSAKVISSYDVNKESYTELSNYRIQ